MKKKIFVGNLSWKVTEELLRPLFETYGEVLEVKIVMDQYTGKSKGFGFVEMKTAEDAEAAIAGLNDKPLLERNLRISLAQPRQEGGPRSENRWNGGDRDRGGDRGPRERRDFGGERRGGSHGGSGGGFRSRSSERRFD